MTVKYNNFIASLADDTMKASIQGLLDQLPRGTFRNHSSLVRQLINIGLIKMWKQVLKEKEDAAGTGVAHEDQKP